MGIHHDRDLNPGSRTISSPALYFWANPISSTSRKQATDSIAIPDTKPVH